MPATLEPSALQVAPASLEPVRVRAKFFIAGEEKFFLKGVTYGPFKPNADGDLTATPERARQDFELMRDLGIISSASIMCRPAGCSTWPPSTDCAC
jgi:hypothetical protein